MKPKVICHVMSSVDGRLLPSRWKAPAANTPAGALFEVYARAGRELNTDAWMFGKGRLVEIFGERFAGHGRKAEVGVRYKAPRQSKRLFIAVDSEGDILFPTSTLRGDDILIVTGPEASQAYVDMLADRGISYAVVANPTELASVLECASEMFGVDSVSLQGGGIIDGVMLAQGLLYEISPVVYPGIDGLGAAPSIFECPGAMPYRPAEGQVLELIDCSRLEHGVVWLRYAVRR